MTTAIYGGSFNPPHLGHREAALSIVREICPDRLLVIPDRVPPHKEMEEGSPSPEDRLSLCRLNFGDLEGAEITDLELRRTGKSYTYDTIRELEQMFPGERFILAVGTDMFLSFEEWYHFEYLLEHCDLAVLAREYDDRILLEETAARFRSEYHAAVRVVSHTPLPMRSEEIRKLLRKRAGADYLRSEVYATIIRKRLYGALPELSWLREQAYAMLDERRIAHVAGCESEAVSLAKHWGEDPETAAESGILHDITKSLSREEQLQLCEKYGIILDSAEQQMTKLLHARTGAAVARDLFGVSEPVFNAIRWHTTGKPDMTLLEKILYIADYIEPTRDFPGVEKVRDLAYSDLDRALLLGLKMTIDEVRESGSEPYIDTINAFHWYQRAITERSN